MQILPNALPQLVVSKQFARVAVSIQGNVAFLGSIAVTVIAKLGEDGLDAIGESSWWSPLEVHEEPARRENQRKGKIFEPNA